MRSRTSVVLAAGTTMAVLLLVTLMPRPAFAQAPGGSGEVAGDIAVGYTILRDSRFRQTFPAGIVLSFAADATPVFRIIGEFNTTSRTVNLAPGINDRLQVLTYMGGARVMFGGKASKWRPFIQVLAGGARLTEDIISLASLPPTNGVALQPGFGVDTQISGRFDFRIQGDYRAIRSRGAFQHEGRLAFSLVFPFGR